MSWWPSPMSSSPMRCRQSASAPPDSAEEHVCKATSARAVTIRAAEAARGERVPVAPDDWHKYWPPNTTTD